jgi:hypothetical protein
LAIQQRVLHVGLLVQTGRGMGLLDHLRKEM